MQDDEYWMQAALKLADRAAELGEVPVGALVVLDNQIIGEGWNQPISGADPTAHAEIMALRQAASYLNNYRLPGACLYVTLEPCTMCAGAMVHSRIKRLVFGAAEPKAGAIISRQQCLDQPWLNHVVSWTGGVLGDVCGQRLSVFFQKRRAQQKQQRQQAQADAG